MNIFSKISTFVSFYYFSKCKIYASFHRVSSAIWEIVFPLYVNKDGPDVEYPFILSEIADNDVISSLYCTLRSSTTTATTDGSSENTSSAPTGMLHLKKLTGDSKEEIIKKGSLYKKLITFIGICIGIILF